MVYMYISQMLEFPLYFFFPLPVLKVAADDVVQASQKQIELSGQTVFCKYASVGSWFTGFSSVSLQSIQDRCSSIM